MSSSADEAVGSEQGYHTINETEAGELQSELPDSDLLTQLSDQFNVLKDENRLKILLYLHREELCVHDLTALTDMSQSAVSHQLSKLRQHELLERRKDGRVVYYSLCDEKITGVIQAAIKQYESN